MGPVSGHHEVRRLQGHLSKGVVAFTVGEESGVAGDGRAVELPLDQTVEINPQGVLLDSVP